MLVSELVDAVRARGIYNLVGLRGPLDRHRDAGYFDVAEVMEYVVDW